jgi:ELWxxDGT repeat protein
VRKIFLAIATALLLVLPSTPALASTSLVPTFGAVQSTAGGFTVNITNYDASYTWTPIATNCATAVIDANGWLTVTGAEANTSTSVTVYTNRSGLTQSSSTISGTSSDFKTAAKGSPEGQNSWTSKPLESSSGDLFITYASYIPAGNRAQVAKSTDRGQSWNVIKNWPISGNWSTSIAVQGQKVAAIWLDGSAIRSSVSLNGGSTWSNPTVVLASGASIARLSVTFSADGDLIAGWDEFFNNDLAVRVALSTNNAATWSAANEISAPATGSWNLALETMGNGNVYAIWDSYGEISAARLVDSTNTWSSRVFLGNRTFYQHSSRGMDALSSTELSVVWAEGAGNRNIMLSSFNGTSWSTPQAIFNGPYLQPTIAYSNTRALITFLGSAGVYVMSAAKSNLTFGSFQLISTPGVTPANASATWVSADTFGVSYNETSNGNYLPKARFSSNGGVSWAAAITPSSDNLWNYSPMLFADSTGLVLFIWHVQNPNVVVHVAQVYSTVPAAAAKELYLVADTNPGSASSNVYAPKSYNGKLYYSASTTETGREFFVFDGTSVQLVADLNPGPASGAYDSNGVVGVYGGKLLLIADNGTTGWELYTYDGNSISLLLDSRVGTTHSHPANFVEYNGKLFFAANIDADGQAHGWVWDYNSAPQRMSTAYAGYSRQYFSSPTVIGNDLYFISRIVGLQAKLTKFNGTTFTEVATNATSISQNAGFGSKLLYSGMASGAGAEPWVFDGTTDTQIADIEVGALSSNPSQFMAACSGVIFPAGRAATGRELYFWNTLSAPTMIAEINPGSASAWPGYLLNTSNGVYFQAQDATYGSELWFSNGTSVTRLTDGHTGAASLSPRDMVKVGETIYMAGHTATFGGELYAYGVKPAGFNTVTYAPSYTITYDANTGTGSATRTASAGSVALDNGSGFSKSGKVLLGWDTNASATTATYAASASYTLGANVTLYAIWGDQPASQGSQSNIASELPNITDIKSRLSKIPTDGGTVTLEGKNLGTTTEVIVGIRPAVIRSTSTDKLTFTLPKMPAGTYDLSLTMNIGKITFSGAVTYVDATGGETTQSGVFTSNTFAIKGFAPDSKKLTMAMASQVDIKIAKSKALAIKCQGETSGPMKATDKALAMSRAKAVCSHIAKKLGVKNITMTTKNNQYLGANYRRVLVTLLTKVG